MSDEPIDTETVTIKQTLSFKRSTPEKLTEKRIGEQLAALMTVLEWFHTNKLGLVIKEGEKGFMVQCNVDGDLLS